MNRKVYLKGELASLFGEEFTVDVSSFREAIKCIDVNRPTFRQYLLSSIDNGVNFSIRAGDTTLDQDSLSKDIEGDFYLEAIPAGSKSGGGKVLAALAILALIIINPGLGVKGLSLYTSGTAATATTAAVAGSLTNLGYLAASIATNLALTGIQQILAPDPATDAEEPTSYLFNGADQNVLEGDPVPVLYGELRVPGTPVSFEILNRKFARNNVDIDDENNLFLREVY